MSDFPPGATLCPTFATSPSVTSETFVLLNNASSPDLDVPQEFKNFFNPVPRDLSQMLKPSRTAVDFTVYIDEDQSSVALDLRSSEAEKQMITDHYSTSVVFAVLDDRSTQDNTVTIYHTDYQCNDDDSEENDPDSEDYREVLRHWRVRFSDAFEMIQVFDTAEMMVIEDYILNVSKQYTGSSGIFEFGNVVRDIEGDRAV